MVITRSARNLIALVSIAAIEDAGVGAGAGGNDWVDEG
jgi:hypothetical protein